jgi:hypothetical protein
MSIIGIEDLFYVSAGNYDFLAENALPYYH